MTRTELLSKLNPLLQELCDASGFDALIVIDSINTLFDEYDQKIISADNLKDLEI